MYQIELKDIPLSLSVSVSNMNLIEPRECYKNISRLILEGNIAEKYPHLLVGFGLRGIYVPSDLASLWGMPPGTYYTRHMFLYNPTEPTYHIVDPTVAIDPNQKSTPLGYYVAATMNCKKYLSALTHGTTPVFAEMMKPLLKWTKENSVRVYESN